MHQILTVISRPRLYVTAGSDESLGDIENCVPVTLADCLGSTSLPRRFCLPLHAGAPRRPEAPPTSVQDCKGPLRRTTLQSTRQHAFSSWSWAHPRRPRLPMSNITAARNRRFVLFS